MKLSRYICLTAIVMAVIVSSCHKSEMVTISKPVISAGQGITSDTLGGSIKGTLLAGKTYYFKTDIIINAGDTLLMQDGVNLIALGDGSTYAKSPQITVNGTFISLGSEFSQNYISVLPSMRTRDNAFKGLWGGIQASATSGDVIIKWTHIGYVGGPAGPANDPAVYTAGAARFSISFSNINANFILEDSWVSFSKDDNVRVGSGKISIMRSTFEMNGESGGEAINCKSGTVGDIAYNLIIGAATNGLKISNSGGTTVQCNVNAYNNTILNSGFRQVQSGRGGSINYEKGAKGKSYNNLIVNCRFGIRITSDADVPNTLYDNQYYYASANNLLTQFYPSTGIAVAKPGDIKSATPSDKNPLFASYNTDAFNYATATIPMGIAAQPDYLVFVGNADFRLNPGSPALNKGKTDFQPLKAVTITGGIYGADITLPGKDIGAFQDDGSGNRH